MVKFFSNTPDHDIKKVSGSPRSDQKKEQMNSVLINLHHLSKDSAFKPVTKKQGPPSITDVLPCD